MQQTSAADHFLRAEADLITEENRRRKSERTKTFGDPIDLASKVNELIVRGNEAWTAESNSIIRRTNLDTGKTVQIFKGHTAPVTCLTLYESTDVDGKSQTLLISASWDRTIRVWNTETKAVISTTTAHGDFVKKLMVIPSESILVSSSSDKTVKLWDLTSLSQESSAPLAQLASISAHTRPVEALAFQKTQDGPLLITGDTMGVMKTWVLGERWRNSADTLHTVRATFKDNLEGHRTGIGAISPHLEYIWTASTDSTVSLRSYPPQSKTSSIHTVDHPQGVRCILNLADSPLSQPYIITGSGDLIRLYDVSELIRDEDDINTEVSRSARPGKGKEHLIAEVDAHFHHVTSLALWMKSINDGSTAEPWIVSSSLDGTLRKWKFDGAFFAALTTERKYSEYPADLVQGKIAQPVLVEKVEVKAGPSLTIEEERELEELMAED